MEAALMAGGKGNEPIANGCEARKRLAQRWFQGNVHVMQAQPVVGRFENTKSPISPDLSG